MAPAATTLCHDHLRQPLDQYRSRSSSLFPKGSMATAGECRQCVLYIVYTHTCMSIYIYTHAYMYINPYEWIDGNPPVFSEFMAHMNGALHWFQNI